MLKIEIALAIATFSSIIFSVTLTSKTIPREWIVWGRVFAVMGLIVSLPGLIGASKYWLNYLPESEIANQIKHSGLIAYIKSVRELKGTAPAIIWSGTMLFVALVFFGLVVDVKLVEAGYKQEVADKWFSFFTLVGIATFAASIWLVFALHLDYWPFTP